MRHTHRIAFALTIAGTAQADILRVDIDAAPGGNGSSWALAYKSLTDALAAASTGDQLWVAEGIYEPVAPAGRNATFTIPSGVGVYGGFNGTESVFIARNPTLNITELNDGNTNSYSIVTIAAPGVGTVLDGFVIKKGTADVSGAGATSRGAGVYASGATPALRQLFITQCSSIDPGSAIYLGGTNASNAVIDRCLIQGNSGEFAVRVSIPVSIIDTDFVANTSGALWLDGSTANIFQEVLRCEFRDHPGSTSLSTVLLNHTSTTAITRIDGALFENNQAFRAGALYYLGAGDHELRNSIIRSNSVSQGTVSGGALFLDMDSANESLLIENTLIIGNSCAGQGGAISKDGPETLRIIGSTIAGNSTSAPFAAGIELAAGVLDMDNTIVYENTGTGTADQRRSIFISGGSATADRCLIQYLGSGPMAPPINGVGSSSLNPLFVDSNGPDNVFGTADDNVRLMPGSPAIDAGNNLFVSPFVSFDIYGQPRFHDDTGTPDTGVDGGLPPVIDIGAAEFQGTTPSDCLADTNHDGVVSPADFSAWVAAFNTMAPECDQNGDGMCSPADFSAWVANFNAGCP